MMTLLRVSNLS
jgi:hypothetical protein